MRNTLISLTAGIVLLVSLYAPGVGSEGMGGGGGMKTKRSQSTTRMGGMGSEMKRSESSMRSMNLSGMTQRGPSNNRMGGMSQGMTERRAIGMSRMSQGVPGISDKKKTSKRRGSAGMGM